MSCQVKISAFCVWKIMTSRGCNVGFHLACIVDRVYIGRIKLAKTGGAFFKYGLLCPVHNEGKFVIFFVM